MNNGIKENVDAIHTAIAENSKISFQYFQWNVKKEAELKRDGKRYEVSPWGLSWDDEYRFESFVNSERCKTDSSCFSRHNGLRALLI